MSHIPAPPPGRGGWPWTLPAARSVETPPKGVLWPRISVITPSYNQGPFLEQTIRSVLLQGYPNLEYIVIDGGSSDESVEIIRKYERFLAHWVSEPDRGQSHAINKGFQLATGQIMCWLNSDDYYLPGTLETVGTILGDGTGIFALVGHCVQVYADGRPPTRSEGRFEGLSRLLQFWKGYHMHQPSIFWRREVFEKVGFLNEQQHYIMDFDYWVRIARHYKFENIDHELSCATYHKDAKTGDAFVKYYQELRRYAPKYWPSPFSFEYWRLKVSMLKHLYYLPVERRLKSSARYRISSVRRVLREGRLR